MPLPPKTPPLLQDLRSRASPSANRIYRPLVIDRNTCGIINSHLNLSTRVLTTLTRHVARPGCQRDLPCCADVRLLVVLLSSPRGLGGRSYLCNSYIVSFLVCDSTHKALLPAAKAGQLPYPSCCSGGAYGKFVFGEQYSLDLMNHEPSPC